MEKQDVAPIKKTQPKFIKLDEVKPGQHGYNVYVKVVESAIKTVKDTERGDLSIAEGKVGDETAVIDVRIVGEYAKLFVKDNVLAIRNGKSEVFKEHHRLELDPWGKATEEKGHAISSVDDKHNLSETAYVAKLQPRGGNREDREDREDREEGGRGGRGRGRGGRGRGRGSDHP